VKKFTNLGGGGFAVFAAFELAPPDDGNPIVRRLYGLKAKSQLLIANRQIKTETQ